MPHFLLPVESVSLSVLALALRRHLENHPQVRVCWLRLDLGQRMSSFADLGARPPCSQLAGLSFSAPQAII